MSVIISNMELPESCAECPLLNTHTYVCAVKINADVKPHARAADCPLVSFDKPVGLTDAEKIICKVYLEDLDKMHTCNEYKLLMNLIDNAQVVEPFTQLEKKEIAATIRYLLGAELLEENGYTEEVINALKSALKKVGGARKNEIR